MPSVELSGPPTTLLRYSSAAPAASLGKWRRTRDALRHKRSQGQRVGNIAFGSRLAADREHVEPDAVERAALAEIRRLRAQGTTLRGIAAALNHGAYRTRRGTPWRLESVARVVNASAARV